MEFWELILDIILWGDVFFFSHTHTDTPLRQQHLEDHFQLKQKISIFRSVTSKFVKKCKKSQRHPTHLYNRMQIQETAFKNINF